MISTKKMNNDIINKIINQSREYELSENKTSNLLNNKIVGLYFLEPSTRTMLSFQCAVYRLGGNVIIYSNDNSSEKKGESFEDTIRAIECYCDLLVLRHPEKNKVNEVANTLNIPVINAGDGDKEHPTQALLDLYTMDSYFRIYSQRNINKILIIGDIKSRTINSLLYLLFKYTSCLINYVIINKDLEKYKDKWLEEFPMFHNNDLYKLSNLEELNNLKEIDYDIVYMTRFQKERYNSVDQNNGCIINKNFMDRLYKNSIVMHPLPRNDEIDKNLDNDNRMVYFDQMKKGVFVRMAILSNIFLNIN